MMSEYTLELSPYAHMPKGIDPLLFLNRPDNFDVMRLLRSCSGDGEGHVIVSVRPASFDARFTDYLGQIDGNGGVQLDRQRLSIIECKPDDEAGAHPRAIEAVNRLASHALSCGWLVWKTQCSPLDPVFQIVHAKSGLFWERHDLPLILLVLPPQDTQRAA